MAHLIATKSFTYATRRLLPGQDFITRTDRDARLLVAIGKARRATGKVAPAVKPAAPDDDLSDLRAEYQAATGKRPYHGWDADQLREKIAEAEAS